MYGFHSKTPLKDSRTRYSWFVVCSTLSMREEGGFEVIKKAILNLSLRHKEHISAYGEGNERRLTGKHETASIDQFSWVRLLLIFPSLRHK